jgi:hypothetical protein
LSRRSIPQCELPSLCKPKANQFFRVDAIPVLGTGKVDLRGVKALAASSSAHVEAEAQMWKPFVSATAAALMRLREPSNFTRLLIDNAER